MYIGTDLLAIPRSSLGLKSVCSFFLPMNCDEVLIDLIFSGPTPRWALYSFKVLAVDSECLRL